jgi:hypothetical protein
MFSTTLNHYASNEGSIPFTRSNFGFVGVLAKIEVHKVKSKN